jgi:hypothetical protein
MRPQSPGSPSWRDFGTPTRESREIKAIWMWASWRITEYTIRGKVVDKSHLDVGFVENHRVYYKKEGGG